MQRNSLGKNALLNAVKQACAIIFPFITFSYSSRVLGADGIGAYSFSHSIISYLLLVAALGIPSYAMREGAEIRDNRDALMRFINEVFSINCIMTVVCYAILVVLLFAVDKIRQYSIIILIQSIQIVLTTLGADWINTIFEDYFYLAVRYVAIQIISLICLFIFVRTEADLLAYVWISALSATGGNVLNWFYLKRHGARPRITRHLNIKRHWKPIFILFCNSIASVIYLNSDITMLGFYSTDGIVGIYTLSSKIYTIVKTLIISIIMVTIPRFSYYISNKNLEEYRKSLRLVANVLITLMVPITLGISIEAEKIILMVGGYSYISGVSVLKILSPAIVFSIVACYISYSVLVPNHAEKYFLYSTITAAFLNMGLNFILLPRLNMVGAAITTLIAEFVVCFLSYFFSRKIIRLVISKHDLITAIFSGFIMVVVCKLIDMIHGPSTMVLVLDIILGGIAYFVGLYLFKNETILMIVDIVKRRLREKIR